MNTRQGKTTKSAEKTIYAAMQILKEAGGSLPRKELIETLEKNVQFEGWEKERYESNGQLKWLTVFLFYTVDCIKAGWLVKQKGVWFITEEGEKALKLKPDELLATAGKAFRKWRAEQIQSIPVEAKKEEVSLEELGSAVPAVNIEQMESQASEEIGIFLEKMPEFEFQHLCSVLLKAMGYYIDYEALPGKDGGIDIIAFGDPLGFSKPRIKVQVKRYKESIKVDIKPIREFKGLLHKGEDIGVFITSGYYTKDAENFARNSDVHIKLINRIEFIELWIENSHKLNNDELQLLPLKPVYFLNKIN